MSDTSGPRQRKSNSTRAEPPPKRPSGKQSGSTKNATPDSTGAGSPSFFAKLLRRVIVGFLIISVTATIILSDHFYVCIFIIAIQIVSFKEITYLRYSSPEARQKRVPWFRTFNWYFLVITLFYLYGKPLFSKFRAYLPPRAYEMLMHYHISAAFAMYCIGFMAFILSLKKGHYKYQFTQLAWTMMTLVIVIVQQGVLVTNIYDGLFWFLLPAACIVINDIAAYFCGVLLGRKIIKRKFLALSPNKTWEGFIGAAIFTLIFAFYFARFLAQYQWFICPKADFQQTGPLTCTPHPVFLPHDYELPSFLSSLLANYFHLNWTHVTILPAQLHALAFALFSSIVAPFGGFFASGMKRAYGIKDFNNIFPGHGGMTDRMDCQMIIGLYVYVHLKTFVQLAGAMTVTQIMHQIIMLPRDQQLLIHQKLTEWLTEAV